MDDPGYRVILTGELLAGFSREGVLGALARFFQVSAGSIVRALDGGAYPIDDILDAAQASSLQQRIEGLGARARVERHSAELGHTGLKLPLQDEYQQAGLMHCPACGHAQLVAARCDECGVVFAEYNRQREQGVRPAAPTPRAVEPALVAQGPRRVVNSRSRDVHADAHADWREEWLDDDNGGLPTEEYHINLFMGMGSTQLASACTGMMLGRRTQLKVGWAGGAVFSPFLWAMYRKMWAWGLVIFGFEILLPVILIAAGGKEGVSDILVTVGLLLMVMSRVFWPLVLKYLYCRHARRTISYMHRLSPTYASDIDIAARGGTSRTSVFVGVVMAIVASLLAWSIVDFMHARYVQSRAVFSSQGEQGGGAQDPLATDSRTRLPGGAGQVSENKWVTTRGQLRSLGQQINKWLLGTGRVVDPEKLNMEDISRALALDSQSIVDGWGRQVYFTAKGPGYKLISAGPDGKFGNSDDVEYRRILER